MRKFTQTHNGFKAIVRKFSEGSYKVYLEPDSPVIIPSEIKPEDCIVKIDIRGFNIRDVDALLVKETDFNKLGYEEVKKRLYKYLGKHTSTVLKYLLKDLNDMKKYRLSLVNR